MYEMTHNPAPSDEQSELQNGIIHISRGKQRDGASLFYSFLLFDIYFCARLNFIREKVFFVCASYSDRLAILKKSI